jgi:hypothetical protein
MTNNLTSELIPNRTIPRSRARPMSLNFIDPNPEL